MSLVKSSIKVLEKLPIISDVLENIGCEIHDLREEQRLQTIFGNDTIGLYTSSDVASTSKPSKNQRQ